MWRSLQKTGGITVEEQEFYIGVTGCPVGIAHTYVAAKALAKAAEHANVTIKVETNGSIGTENSPTTEEIQKAKAIIIASDKQVDLERFHGKKVLFTGTKEAIKHADSLIAEVRRGDIPVYSGENITSNTNATKEISPPSKGEHWGETAYRALMNGVSHMIPFVILGGLLIALSLSLGGKPSEAGLVIPEGSFWNSILNMGVVGFRLMIPILAGYIAYAIGDRPALVAGMVGGWIANDGSFYNSTSGAGFLGAIVAGFFAGYVVKLLKKVPWNKYIQPLVPIMIIPIISTVAVGSLFILVIGSPISSMMSMLDNFLVSLSTGNIVILGIIFGLMQGFDMGGPIAKVPFLFSVGLLTQNQPQFMGALACAIPVAPIGMGIATFLHRKIFTIEERENGIASFAMGLVGISEGAIPFAVANPLAIIPATMLGSAVASTLAFLLNVNDQVAHGGPIVALIGAMNKPFLAVLIMLTGSLVTAIAAIFMKSLFIKKSMTRVNT